MSCDCAWLTTTKFDLKGIEVWLIGRITCVAVIGAVVAVVNCPERYGKVSNSELTGAV